MAPSRPRPRRTWLRRSRESISPSGVGCGVQTAATDSSAETSRRRRTARLIAIRAADGAKPAAEALRLPQLPDLLHRAEEDFLADFLGLRIVAQVAVRRGVHRPLVTLHQSGQRPADHRSGRHTSCVIASWRSVVSILVPNMVLPSRKNPQFPEETWLKEQRRHVGVQCVESSCCASSRAFTNWPQRRAEASPRKPNAGPARAQDFCRFARFRGRWGNLAGHAAGAGDRPASHLGSSRATADMKRSCVVPATRFPRVRIPKTEAILLATMFR